MAIYKILCQNGIRNQGRTGTRLCQNGIRYAGKRPLSCPILCQNGISLMPKWHSQNVYEPAVRADHHTPINKKGEFAMFYIKANGIKTSIKCDNVFTYCPACGKKHYVDLFEILTGGGDLYSTAVYCLACSKKKDASASGKATNGPSESKRGNF